MPWGRITVGGVELRETVDADDDGVSLKVAGQESHPPGTRAYVEAVHHNLVAMGGLVVPVTFTDKAGLTGFYLVEGRRSVLVREQNGLVQAANWGLDLRRVGLARDVEIESVVTLVPRTTELVGQTPVFWHAPAVGASSYLTGTTVPSSWVDRVSADGVVRVHLGIPADFPPRWTIRAEDYLLGAARVSFAGFRRLGRMTPSMATWELHNGLVRVVSGPDGTITVSAWGGSPGAWRSAKTYAFTVNGAALTGVPEVTILRNDPELVTLRLTYPSTPGRLTVDLGLRRGARTVTGIIKRHSAAILGVARTAAEAATATAGGLVATAADVDGFSFVMGSSRTVTKATATAALSKAGQLALDFYLGHATAQLGDSAGDLHSQFLGSTGERSRVVYR